MIPLKIGKTYRFRLLVSKQERSELIENAVYLGGVGDGVHVSFMFIETPLHTQNREVGARHGIVTGSRQGRLMSCRHRDIVSAAETDQYAIK